MTIAQRLFDAHYAEAELEELLNEAGVEFDRLGWDHYDNSVELYGVAPEIRLSTKAQKVIFDAGFSKAYVNHTDKWETHYNYQGTDFIEHKGWRVSYPHKRGENEKGILVEEKVSTWPKEWFENGYCIVKDRS